ncbi:MAG: dihydropteroate synthase [Armatimonadetes bacterium]|nr:dihydropteroate synthase [Armatimonadota bacterium]
MNSAPAPLHHPLAVLPDGRGRSTLRYRAGPAPGRTLVMGILNVTPDSFSDGGCFEQAEEAVRHALRMVEEGADVIDIGGESTRPGSAPVSAEEEMRRVLPVIERLVAVLPVPLSIDTRKASVACAALEAGAGVVNDVSALLDDPEMADVVASFGAAVVLMHKKGSPKDMQQNPRYIDVVAEVRDFLTERAEAAQAAGIAPEAIIIDPGIGFGKRPEHNLELLRDLRRLKSPGYPLLLGTSRKTTIGTVLNLPVDGRLEGTAATVALGIAGGADMVRVHDVRAMSRVARMSDAVVRPGFFTP